MFVVLMIILALVAIVMMARQGIRKTEVDALMAVNDVLRGRNIKAKLELQDLIDGGEECRGMDGAISRVIRILDGEE